MKDDGVVVQEIDVFLGLVHALHTLFLLRFERDPPNSMKVGACSAAAPCPSV